MSILVVDCGNHARKHICHLGKITIAIVEGCELRTSCVRSVGVSNSNMPTAKDKNMLFEGHGHLGSIIGIEEFLNIVCFIDIILSALASEPDALISRHSMNRSSA